MKKLFLVFCFALVLRVLSLALSMSVLDLNPGQVAQFQDGPSYLHLASHWPPYPHVRSVLHFPLYPALIAVVNFFLSSAAVSGLAVSILCGSLATAVFGALLRRTAFPAWFEISLIFAVFPFRWFNIGQLVMSEPLFLLCLLFGLFALEKGRPALGGTALGMACLTKPSGVLLIPAFLYLLLSQDPDRRTVVRFAFPALLLPGLLLLYFWVRFGDPLVYLGEHSRLWGGSYFSFPFRFFVEGLADTRLPLVRKGYVLFLLCFYLGGLLKGLLSWPKDPRRWSLWLVWTIPVLTLLVCLKGETTNWGMISFARLALPAAPAVLILWLEGLKKRQLYWLLGLGVPVGFFYNVLEFWEQMR